MERPRTTPVRGLRRVLPPSQQGGRYPLAPAARTGEGGAVRIFAGIATGITLSILAHIIWKPALGWALSRGDS